MRRKKDDPALPRGNSSDVKPNIIEVDMKIGHKNVMAISSFFMDRDDPDHLLDQAIHYLERIGDTIAEGANGMDHLFMETLSVDGPAALWVSVYMHFFMDRDAELPCNAAD